MIAPRAPSAPISAVCAFDAASAELVRAPASGAIAERLEAALDLVASAAVVDRLTEIAQLCGEAEVLARAGGLLLRTR